MSLCWKKLPLAFWLLCSAFCLADPPPYRVLYPYGLLTEDHGILSEEEDLAVDTWRGIPHPYEERGFNGGYPYWSCFSVSQAKAHYEHWHGTDELKGIELCDLQFTVETSKEIHLYTGRRPFPLEQCRDYVKKWKQLVRDEPYVCFNAYDGELGLSRPGRKKPEKIWTWDRIKTRKGCLDYFGFTCDFNHWKKLKPLIPR